MHLLVLFTFRKLRLVEKKGEKGLMSPRSCPAWTTAIQPFPFPALRPALPASPASFYSTLNPIIMSMVWPNSKIEVQVSTFDSLGTWAAARVRRSRCAVLCVGQSPSDKSPEVGFLRNIIWDLCLGPSLNTQSCIKGLLGVRDFCFCAVWAARPVLKKRVWANYEQLLRVFFFCFEWQTFFLNFLKI